ncbi:response regulator transcription factor [Terriglobus roseus]|uniref:response regulator transcription factor n=1 Tax=Terriglobus roseus TaxID=392734 RepID=UPI000942AF12|nr:response regulator transcription factor [Terriglobus roseus]
MRVLLVEDEVRLAENVARGLREGPGYAVDVVHDGAEALEFCNAGDYDLIVLDLMLPGCNGDEIVQTLRTARKTTPVLILTAVSDTDRTIALLDAGADDFMTKPFDLGELIARCRALIRRSKGASQALLRFGDLELHTGEQSVIREGRSIDLSPTEFRILEYLMYRPRIVVSKRELLEHLYDFTWEHHSNVIEVHVSNLRRKLRGNHDHDVVETLRGRGYRLAQS